MEAYNFANIDVERLAILALENSAEPALVEQVLHYVPLLDHARDVISLLVHLKLYFFALVNCCLQILLIDSESFAIALCSVFS